MNIIEFNKFIERDFNIGMLEPDPFVKYLLHLMQ